MRTRFLRVPVAAAVLLAVLFSATPSVAQETVRQAAPDRVIYPIFGWLPAYGADLSLPAGPPCADCPSQPSTSSGTSSGLSGAWFAAIRLEFGRVSLAGNANYAGLSAEKDRPFFRAKVDLLTASVFGGVRVAGPWFLEAGARYYGLNAKFNVLTFGEVQWKPGRWAPAVGTTVRPRLGSHVMLYTHLDVGGLGSSRTETINGEARIEFRPIRHLAVTAGYAFCRIRLDDTLLRNTSLSRPVHFEQTLHGPSAGIGIPF